MKLKFAPLLMQSWVVVLVGILAIATNAEPNNAEEILLSLQSSPELTGINLTPQQVEQITQIQQEVAPQLKAILPVSQLTDEQKALLANGTPIQIPLAHLTPEQHKEMQQLMEVYFARIEAVLTPEQQQQFDHQRNYPKNTGFQIPALIRTTP